MPSAPSSTPGPTLSGGPLAVSGRAGIVTSVEDNATRIGVQILENGGNAADAAIATAFALAVTHPSAGNLGGGGFLLARPAHGATIAIDFRETAPRALTQTNFNKMLRDGAQGPAAVGIPGTVAGLFLLHQKLGTRPWRELVAPAIALAERGHRMGRREALTIKWNWKSLGRHPRSLSALGTNKGAPPSAGTLVKRPDLAKTLGFIAAEGREGFYAGSVAKALASLGKGGLISLDDVTRYEAKLREPLVLTYHGWRVETMPPPSAGGVTLLLLLRFLETNRGERFSHLSADALHLFAEASKRAQAERRFSVADPDRFPPAANDTARAVWQTGPLPFPDHPLTMEKAIPSSTLHPLYNEAMKELEHTTHLSVVDKEGMVVSLTTTLSAAFGAKIVAPGTGFLLNNSVAAFGTAGANTVAPGFRTTSSMAPTLVTAPDGTTLILGSPGGDTIPSTVAQVLTHLVDHREPLDAAVAALRVHHGFVPDALQVERSSALPSDVIANLKLRGHKITSRAPFGDANNIIVVGGTAYGVADQREGGLALAVGHDN
ncbi:MAG: gamma-glutamyltransferase [Polyangiaceae bacterium]|nr:gamma-glutamyltransferase [Polyangiaceae bacterium]